MGLEGLDFLYILEKRRNYIYNYIYKYIYNYNYRGKQKFLKI